ncbi:MAG: hypothetical protein ABI488_16655 [Polyangiaceae bacterium]
MNRASVVVGEKGRQRSIAIARRGWLVLLPLIALGSCGEGHKQQQAPSISVVTSGAGEGAQGGDEQLPGGPEGGAGRVMPKAPCNGWPQLCERPYDSITYPVAHAAMADSASFWTYPAEDTDLRSQLDASIRGLMLEVHAKGGIPTLCFNDCAEGQAPLIPELARVAGFLDDNPREVVTLLIDNRVPASDVAQSFKDAKLARYLYLEEPGGEWPTLGEMIDQGERIVVFLADAAGAPRGYRSLWDNVRATTDSARTARELSCDTPSGNADAPLVLLLQTLVEPVTGSEGEAGTGGAPSASVGRPSAELAATVNRDPFFSERMAFCKSAFGQEPTFVAVDFYDESDVIGITQRASGLSP